MPFLLGTGLSSAIELTQVYLPTRDPSLIDVIMNSAGAILGAAAYQSLRKTGVREFNQNNLTQRILKFNSQDLTPFPSETDSL
jgi:glycopeptide antibiotics resistance protein